MTIHLNALGDNAYAIRISTGTPEEKNILIDPVFEAIRLSESVEDTLGRFNVNYVLLTHLYPGWEGVAQLLRSSPLTTVVAQEALIERLKAEISVSDLNAITMQPGNEVDFPWPGMPVTGAAGLSGKSELTGSLVMTESPYRPEGVLGDLQVANGFIVNAEGHQICHTGYHPFDASIKDIGAAYKPDVVIFPVSAALSYNAEAVYRAIMWLGCDIVIPFDATPESDQAKAISQTVPAAIAPDEAITELDDFSPTGSAVFDFTQICASIDIYTPALCRVLEKGQSYSLEPTHSSGRTAGPESRY